MIILKKKKSTKALPKEFRITFIGGNNVTMDTYGGDARLSNTNSNTPWFLTITEGATTYLNRAVTGTTSLTAALNKTYTGGGLTFTFPLGVTMTRIFVASPESSIGISNVDAK